MNWAAREREKREVNGGPRTREEWATERASETGLFLSRVWLAGQNAPTLAQGQVAATSFFSFLAAYRLEHQKKQKTKPAQFSIFRFQ